MNYIVVGPPGSGKSTQAKLIAEELFLPYIEASQILAEVARTENGLGKLVRKSMGKGELVDESLALMAVESHLQNSWLKKGFVLDGFPRSLWQAKNFKTTPDKIFYIKVSDKINTQRLIKRRRKDDKLGIIKMRLKDYHFQTEPILRFYRQLGILEEVDGERPIKNIFQDILERLK